VVGIATLIGGTSGVAWAAFGSTTTNGSNSFTAKTDFRAPTALATIGARADGFGTPGHVRQGAGYYLYANVSDSGSPASGVQSVTANANSFDAGVTEAALTTTGGPWTIGGTSYAYRTVQLTADTPLTTGASYSYSLTMTDFAGNSGTTSGFTVTIATPSYRDTVLADGPAAYWRLGEASGATTAVDVMGTADATYFGGYTLGVQGALVNDPDTSFAIAQSGGAVAPDAVALRPDTQVSIELWIKPDAFTPTQFLLTKNLDYFLYIDGGAVIFGYRSLPGPVYWSVSSTTFTVNAWQHVVGTYDGSQMVIYRNGVAVATAPSSGAITVVEGIVDIGNYASTGWYSGGMDELAVYSRALTSDEVLRHYERGTLP
jgi:hypothetical protein